jgi:hypothetical protein
MIRVVGLEHAKRVTAGGGGQHSRATHFSQVLTGRVDLPSRVGRNIQETKYEPVACSKTKTRQCRGKEENEIKMRERTP